MILIDQPIDSETLVDILCDEIESAKSPTEHNLILARVREVAQKLEFNDVQWAVLFDSLNTSLINLGS